MKKVLVHLMPRTNSGDCFFIVDTQILRGIHMYVRTTPELCVASISTSLLWKFSIGLVYVIFREFR